MISLYNFGLIVFTPLQIVLYASVQGAFQYGITAPLRRRRPREDPDPPALERRQPQLQRLEAGDHLEDGDAPLQAPRHQVNHARLGRNQVRQRVPNKPQDVETVRAAYSEDEMDGQQRAGGSEDEQNPSAASDRDNQQETQQELAGTNAANTTREKTKPPQSDSSQAKAKSPNVKKTPEKPQNVKKPHSQDKPSKDNAVERPQPAETQPSETTDVPVSYF